ncbi:MAG: glycosyltransferase [Fimbriimonadaceae bacterium]|nr:glycosyltransferase [Fimbriimonadaceae bacterium]
MPVPRVSILVPSYNHGRFLERTLGSVIAQTFDDWELLLLDDRSPDDSVDVARRIAAQDPRIRVEVNERNLGAYGTEQRALERTSGNLVAVLNSDDFWHPEKLERQIAALDKRPDASCAFVLGWMADREGNPQTDDDVHAGWPTDPQARFLPHLLHENRILASGVLFRREALRFEETCRYSGDWVALLEAVARGPALCVPERLTFWRQHGENSYLISPKQLLEELRVRRAIQAHAARWFALEPASAVRRGLGRNAMNLFACAMFFGSRREALRAGVACLRYHADRKSALKRTLSGFLPADYTRRYFWPDHADAFPLDLRAARRDVAALPPLVFRLPKP